MHKLRQLFQLHAAGHGTKYISRLTGIARNTVKKYLLRLVALRLPVNEVIALSDSRLAVLFLEQPVVKADSVNKRKRDLECMFDELAALYKKRGITKKMVYERYRERYPDGYRSSHFLELFNAYTGRTKPSTRVPHKAGDKLFIDFTGRKLHLVDPQTGEVQEVEVFVAILGQSQLTYVTAVPSQKKEDFIKACERALHFYGGVPQAIVPDNLKSAVKKASRYEAELNEGFAAFAAHYNTYVFPTRAYKPKDKALVEGAVKIIYTTIFTKIDEIVYTDIDVMNSDILLYLQTHNNTLLTDCDYSRQMQFDQIERATLQPLNPYPYDPVSSKMATVGKTGYVVLDHRYYSIPYKYIGKKIKLVYNSSKVEAWMGYELVAVHQRQYGKEKYIENPEHLASWNRYPTEWNPEKFIGEAAQISGDVAAYIKKVLGRNEYPEKNYRACQGILNFAKRVGNTRLQNACKRADSFGKYSFGIIERILQSKMDMLPMEGDLFADTTTGKSAAMPQHDNIRGEGYYQ
ncbi:MAG TPA: IS21 family transposase [Niabella sp.]|nr:IS21 family transposase [Niabella sp.]HRB36157.1 IS21 family transposase [Niabella sp.]HRB64909.1 IS21 family transposase [Niabella sp.]HRB79459.1 IS21 family transposase [Niabella sp.]